MQYFRRKKEPVFPRFDGSANVSAADGGGVASRSRSAARVPGPTTAHAVHRHVHRASTDRAVPVALNDLQRVFAVLQCTMINVPITVTVAFENEIRVT